MVFLYFRRYFDETRRTEMTMKNISAAEMPLNGRKSSDNHNAMINGLAVSYSVL
jgi:hypothetical protein